MIKKNKINLPINPKQAIIFYGKKVHLLPYLTYPEEHKLIEKLKNKSSYSYKHGIEKTGINGWFLHYNNKILSQEKLIILFKKYFPEQKLSYYDEKTIGL